MRPALSMLLLGLACLAAGCSDAPLDSEGTDGVEAADPAPVPCTPATMNNNGVAVNGLYVEGGETWRETNGITNLQKSETCEGPADTKVAP